MGIRTLIVAGLVFVAASARAGTNNVWISSATDFWDNNEAWSLGVAPTNTDLGDFITNAVSKTVIIDDIVSGDEANELTISNLTVSGTATTTNTLSLSDMNFGALVPLHVLNLFTLGMHGQLQMTNSMLHVANASISASSILRFAVGSSFTPVVVDNNLALSGILNVVNGGGFTNTTYTLMTYGGALAYSGLTVGSMPTNFTGVVDATSTVGQVNLVVSQVPPPPPGGFHITSIVQNTSDILVTWVTVNAGNYFVQAVNGGAGGYSSNNFQDITGAFSLPGSTTTNYLDVGGATNAPTRFYRIRFSQ